jgi:hypothetical protein
MRAAMRVINRIPLGCSLLLPVDTVNCVQTLKGKKLILNSLQKNMNLRGERYGARFWMEVLQFPLLLVRTIAGLEASVYGVYSSPLLLDRTIDGLKPVVRVFQFNVMHLGCPLSYRLSLPNSSKHFRAIVRKQQAVPKSCTLNGASNTSGKDSARCSSLPISQPPVATRNPTPAVKTAHGARC